MLIESSLIYEAVSSLGIETPVPEAEVTRVELPPEAKKPTPPPAPPPAIEIVKPSAMPITHLAGTQQILSEFAAEADLESGARANRLAVALFVLALAIAAGIAAGLLYYQTQTVDLGAAGLPMRPTWTSTQAKAAADRAVPREASAPTTVRANDGSYAIQVASLTSRDRADRLVSDLKKAGFGARTVEFNLGPPRGLVLQIRVDGYESAQAAGRDLARIRALRGYEDALLLQR
jgi:hypothetical protein